MDSIVREALFNQVRSWMLDAGTLIKERIDDPFEIKTKSTANDLVTIVDQEVEMFFARKIKKYYQDHLLLSEEGFGDDLKNSKGTVWIIDPIDGTMNFVNQKRHFAISIGIYHEGIGEIGFVYDVMANNLYSAMRDGGAYKNDKKLPSLDKDAQLKNSIICLNHHWLCENSLVNEKAMQSLVKNARGTRTYGSAALEFAHVAEGIIGAYLTLSLEPWDIAAGRIIVNEVGGKTTDIDGNEVGMMERSSIITGNANIHQEIITNYLLNAKKESV
ncbi:MAG TPA: inositol monophosphatase family protein [Pseudogracilibacillus sp.]|nr:inositol monophosphatase family protein [Pseudogracilibacillus sp.]